jgi:hypothetical protein
VASEVWVSLERFDADFTTAGDARLVGVSIASDSVAWTLDLPGVANCAGLAMAPSGNVVALSCTGVSGDTNPLQRSSVVLVDATAHPPVELKRFPVPAQLGARVGFTLAYASDTLLVGVAPGDSSVPRDDLAYTLDLATGMAHVLVDGGAPFVLGDVHCSPGCTDLCFLADAQANDLRVWKASGGTLNVQPAVPVDPKVGLPPRSIGAF